MRRMRLPRLLLGGPLSAVLSICLASSPLHAQQASPEQGQTAGPTRLWQPAPGTAVTAEMFAPETLSRLRARAEDKGASTDWLALGAALLHAGDWEGATPPLRQALETSEPEEREDATYDLALAYAVRHPHRTTAVVYISGTGIDPRWHDDYRRNRLATLGDADRQDTAVLMGRAERLGFLPGRCGGLVCGRRQRQGTLAFSGPVARGYARG